MKIDSIQNISNCHSFKNSLNSLDIKFCAKNKRDDFVKEIDTYRNPITGVADEKFSLMVDIVKNYGAKNYFEIALEGLDSKGKCNDAVFRMLDLFYTTAPDGLVGKFLNIKESITRLVKVGAPNLSYYSADCDPLVFIKAIKNIFKGQIFAL